MASWTRFQIDENAGLKLCALLLIRQLDSGGGGGENGFAVDVAVLNFG
jgi:hypothetical protein